MDIRKLQRVIVDGLEDVKAQNIVVFNTEHLSPLFERVIVASGTSNRQTKSLAASVRDAVKAAGEPAPRTEGEANGEWIIVDCGAAVVHVMQPAIRDYYHLEELWGDKPVQMKIGARAAAAPGQGRAPRRGATRDARQARQAQPATRGTVRRTGSAIASASRRRRAPVAGVGARRLVGASRPSARKAAPARHVVRTAARKVGGAPGGGKGTAATTTRRPAAKKASAQR